MNRENTIAKLERFAEQKGLSYRKIAQMIGIGQSTLSEIRKGTYRGNEEEILLKLEDLIERHKQGIRRVDFSVETDTKKRIFFTIDTIKKYVASNAANEIISSAKIAYIVGRSGIGKTHALMEYQKTYGSKIIFITAENGDKHTTVMRKIARSMRMDTKGTTDELKENIKERLRFTETIIIIDEGEHLSPKVIDVIRAIADQTGIGLVIAGTDQLKHQITKNHREYEYLYSRGVTWMLLKELTIKDVDKIFRKFIQDDMDFYEEEDIVKMTSFITKEVKGSARILENLLTMASMMANEGENFEKTGGLITLDYLKAASKVVNTI